jgi:hypothetical protein
MDPETNFCSAESTHRTDSVTLEGLQQGVLAVVKNTGKVHYTEENPTIPETPALQEIISSPNMIKTALDPANPGQVGGSKRVHAS